MIQATQSNTLYGSGSVTTSISSRIPQGYYTSLDMTFYSNASSPSVSVGGVYLTVERINGIFWRAYGDIPGNYEITVSGLPSNGYVSWYNLRYTLYHPSTSIRAVMNGVCSNTNFSTKTGDGFWTMDPNAYGGRLSWYGVISFPDWRKYDFVTVYLKVLGPGISVGTLSYDTDLPYRVEEILPANIPAAYNDFLIRITLDVRNADRMASADPMIRVSGPLFGGTVIQLSLPYAYGYIEKSVPDTSSRILIFLRSFSDRVATLFGNLHEWLGEYNRNIQLWFDTLGDRIATLFGNLHEWINYFSDRVATLFGNLHQWLNGYFDDLFQILNPSTPDPDLAPEQNQAQQHMNEIQGQLDIIDSLKPPDLSGISAAPPQMVAAPTFLTAVFRSGSIGQLFFVIFGLMIVGYLLYGKKGR